MNGSKNVTNLMIIIAACSIGGIIFGGILLLPKFQDFQALNKIVEGKRNELTYRAEYFLELQKVEAQIKEYQPELAKIDVALPNEPSLPSLFDFLQISTSQSGLVISNMGNFTVSESSKYPGLKEVSLSLDVSGPYESLKNFLSTLEKSSRLIDVGSVSFSASKNDQGTKNQPKDIFAFRLAIKVYSY
ncbi:MAG: type 4a pilus biogenesis protein PilO [Candidatus Nealsonbacteria bacterium]|nr:type 4a pilus biogenesis protein PilO [Candidatus Nealsonbacteria bacterium]